MCCILWHRLWGEKVNLREQHDAFEFFNCLLDNLDEGIKEYSSRATPVSRVLGGSFADQKICKGCPHRYVILKLQVILKAHMVCVLLLVWQVSLHSKVSTSVYFCHKIAFKMEY